MPFPLMMLLNNFILNGFPLLAFVAFEHPLRMHSDACTADSYVRDSNVPSQQTRIDELRRNNMAWRRVLLTKHAGAHHRLRPVLRIVAMAALQGAICVMPQAFLTSVGPDGYPEMSSSQLGPLIWLQLLIVILATYALFQRCWPFAVGCAYMLSIVSGAAMTVCLVYPFEVHLPWDSKIQQVNFVALLVVYMPQRTLKALPSGRHHTSMKGHSTAALFSRQ